MTDTTSHEAEAPAPVQDFSADDAKYQALEQRFAEKSAPEPELRQAEPEVEQRAEEPREDKRAPLPPEELEKRWKQAQAAMKEERRKRQELEERLSKAEPQKSQEDQLLALIETLREDDDDPIEDITSVKRVLKEFAARQKAEAEAAQAQTQQQTQFQRFSSTIAEAEAEFRDETPDYDKAQEYFKESLRKELEGLGLDGDELQQEYARQVLGVAQKALEKGKNPAEVVYSLAKLRGYAGQQVKAEPVIEQKPVVDQVAVDKAAEVLQTLNKSQQASKSLSAVGGVGASAKEVTMAQVAKLSGKDVLKGYAALKEQAKRAGTYR